MMKLLFLYGNQNAMELFHWLKNQGNEIVATSEKINSDLIKNQSVELIISYTYRHIIKPEILEAVNHNAINLHISYLPWNRGANPNLWSWIEGTPKGVTIHYIDSIIDHGDIIAQKLVTFSESETLESTYKMLNDEIVSLFKQIYFLYPFWDEMKKRALGIGSNHKKADFIPYDKIINGNYNILVSEFSKKVKEMELNKYESNF